MAENSMSNDGGPANPVAEIAAERRRQIGVEGWSAEHDDAHTDESLAVAAACYAMPDRKMNRHVRPKVPVDWPWASGWWKPKDRRRDLIRAGALIVAEIERLDRAAARKSTGGESE